MTNHAKDVDHCAALLWSDGERRPHPTSTACAVDMKRSDQAELVRQMCDLNLSEATFSYGHIGSSVHHLMLTAGPSHAGSCRRIRDQQQTEMWKLVM